MLPYRHVSELDRSLSRAKGTDAETKVERYFNANGLRARRNPLRGTKDRGDIWLPHGVVVSVKDDNHHRIGEWLRDAEEQAANETAESGEDHTYVVVVKERRGPMQSGKVEDWWVITRLKEYVRV